jgi:hypothetical protein
MARYKGLIDILEYEIYFIHYANWNVGVSSWMFEWYT